MLSSIHLKNTESGLFCNSRLGSSVLRQGSLGLEGGTRAACKGYKFAKGGSNWASFRGLLIQSFKKIISIKKNFWTLDFKFWGQGYLDYKVYAIFHYLKSITIWHTPGQHSDKFCIQNCVSMNRLSNYLLRPNKAWHLKILTLWYIKLYLC